MPWEKYTESYDTLHQRKIAYGRMILNLVLNRPLVYGTIEENSVTRTKTYEELSDIEKLQHDCDIRATNIVLQGIELSQQKRECKLYNEFDSFASAKGESLHEYYLSKFVIDIKLAKNMHTSNYDQLYAYLSQHEGFLQPTTNSGYLLIPETMPLFKMAGSQFSKYRDDRGVIIQPVQEVTGLRVLQQLIRQGSSVVTIVRARESCQVLDEEQLTFLADPRVIEGQDPQTTMHVNVAFQTNDLDTFDSDCDEAPSARAMLMANLSTAILDYKNMEKCYLDEYSECVEFKAELLKKNEMVGKVVYNEISKNYSKLEQHCISLEIAMQIKSREFSKNRPCQNQDAPAFKEYFEINDLKAQLKGKDTTISNLKRHIANLKGKIVANCNELVNKPTVLELECL
nr:hypothetical protein [Tanacetum cinerariifolium]